MASNHTGAHVGKRVHVVLRDGTEIIGKFLGRASRFTVIGGKGYATRIANRAIRSLQLAKHLHVHGQSRGRV